MFTGIVTDIGTVRAREDRGDTRLVIGTAYDVSGIDLGASIACSGACLTVVDKGVDEASNGPAGWFAVDASAETLARTAPGMWDVGRRLNLERALRVGDELGGHIVTGHVDAVGRIVSIEPTGDSLTVTVEAPPALAPHIAPKGSITLDGVSLTVNEVTDQPDGGAHFTLNIIPHTQTVTTLDEAAPGRPVNLEIDVLARYLARMQQVRG
ncbi:riboflavin synthase [Sphingopyxis panaciterrulae]|uniref:Riboflavin synthase n=1 Tax=Sphingopyxis panaciterrulae TaxID=462372 RepID=A0A7W9B1U8_9SPHN|nr:riboflavin synthase [Sphingopyxis panaciterrulae]MBB5704705.1 riboflavin synthase [Sphingopyxis panaciterrulae]